MFCITRLKLSVSQSAYCIQSCIFENQNKIQNWGKSAIKIYNRKVLVTHSYKRLYLTHYSSSFCGFSPYVQIRAHLFSHKVKSFEVTQVFKKGMEWPPLVVWNCKKNMLSRLGLRGILNLFNRVYHTGKISQEIHVDTKFNLFLLWAKLYFDNSKRKT